MTSLPSADDRSIRDAHGSARVSPDWVRISYASAMALRFRSGRFTRPFDFGGINLLLNYDDGCLSDCGYCGLARSRAGAYEEKSFIRVEWPLVETDELIARMREREDKLSRLCISMVTHGRAFEDTMEISRKIRAEVKTPLSILVAPPVLNEGRLREMKHAGVDMIGIGVDAVTEALFHKTRTDVPKGGLDWNQYWDVVGLSREIFGPWKVNCHLLVGLGENDADLFGLFDSLASRQIFSYLFCFNAEPESRMADHQKSTIKRWRRVQLGKFLLEERGYGIDSFRFDGDGMLSAMKIDEAEVEKVVSEGMAFMTNGCPGEGGEPGCTRPMGSWRAAEEPRDYPWKPHGDDLAEIRAQLDLPEVIGDGGSYAQPTGRRVPPVAGRFAE